MCVEVFFFNDTATTEIYTLSLHDALPIFSHQRTHGVAGLLCRGYRHSICDRTLARTACRGGVESRRRRAGGRYRRSEEHTSELQSRQYLVCRLLLEKKKHLFCLLS